MDFPKYNAIAQSLGLERQNMVKWSQEGFPPFIAFRLQLFHSAIEKPIDEIILSITPAHFQGQEIAIYNKNHPDYLYKINKPFIVEIYNSLETYGCFNILSLIKKLLNNENEVDPKNNGCYLELGPKH